MERGRCFDAWGKRRVEGNVNREWALMLAQGIFGMGMRTRIRTTEE
jgi:hypothetical protein